jgi:hypothetical protein
MLVLDDLKTGKLVAPFGFVPSRRKLVLWIAPHLDGRADAEKLAGWLAAQMKNSEEAPPPGLRIKPPCDDAAEATAPASATTRSRRRLD